MKAAWLFALLAACCGAALAAPADAPATRLNCPDTIQNVFKCDRYREGAVLRRYPRLFQRQGGSLLIRLANGKALALEDVPDAADIPWDTVRHYSVVHYFPEVGFFLVMVAFFEGETSYLFDARTGKKVAIGGDVLLAPDRKRFVAFGEDIEARFSPNFIAVYRLQGRALVQEFHEDAEDWAPVEVNWRDARTIAFKQKRWATDGVAGFIYAPTRLESEPGARRAELEWRYAAP